MYAEEIISMINGPMLREQRRAILRFIDEANDPIASRCYTEAESDALEGLTQLLDEIADCCHDVYGKDCLLEEPELERKAEEVEHEQRIQYYNHC